MNADIIDIRKTSLLSFAQRVALWFGDPMAMDAMENLEEQERALVIKSLSSIQTWAKMLLHLIDALEKLEKMIPNMNKVVLSSKIRTRPISFGGNNFEWTSFIHKVANAIEEEEMLTQGLMGMNLKERRQLFVYLHCIEDQTQNLISTAAGFRVFGNAENS